MTTIYELDTAYFPPKPRRGVTVVRFVLLEDYKKREQELLKLFEMRVLKPYEGVMVNGTKEEQTLHAKILDRQREWFNKLSNEVSQ